MILQINKSFYRVLRPVFISIVLFCLSGCNQEQPTSYEIPKEEREVQPPAAANNASPTKMPLLPGMKEAAEKSASISYNTPEAWEEIPPGGIRKANFKISGDSGSAEVTVLTFPGNVGGQLANINRWRGQIGLGVVTPEEIANFTENLEIAGHQGLYVHLEGEAQSIAGALLPLPDETWFFKMMGDTPTVLANETEMKQFLNSVEFEAPIHDE